MNSLSFHRSLPSSNVSTPPQPAQPKPQHATSSCHEGLVKQSWSWYILSIHETEKILHYIRSAMH